jgi:hypothetical protein
MPLGPRVVFTRSAIAIAPTKEDCTVTKDAIWVSWSSFGTLYRPPIRFCLFFSKSDQLTKRAFSPFSSVAPACKTLCVKFEGTCKSWAYQKWFRLDVDLISIKEDAIEEHQLTPGCPISNLDYI